MDQAQDLWEKHRSVRFKRIVHPHIALEKLAHDCLGIAEANSEKEQMYWCLAAITFAALSIEAFLNVVGDLCIERWMNIERHISPSRKLDILEKTLKFEVNRDIRPFNSFKMLFDFRNLIAHAKPETLPFDITENHDCAVPISEMTTRLTNWENLASIDNARIYVRDASEIINDLMKRGNIILPSQDHSRIELHIKTPNDSGSSNK